MLLNYIGIMRYNQQNVLYKGNVAISLKKDYVTCYFEKDSIAFQLSSLWANFTNNPYPVITGQTAGSYDAWISLNNDKPEYRDILSEKAYTHWQRIVKSLIKKHSEKFDILLFTVPGRIIAYTEKHTDVKKLHHRLDCAMNDYGLYTNRYRFLDIGYKPSVIEENPEKYILRTIVKDRSKNMLVAIDRIYLENSNEILCLMYTCMGKFDYVYSKYGIFHYHENSSWERFEPLKNLPMAFEFFYKQCDPVSIEAFKFLNNH